MEDTREQAAEAMPIHREATGRPAGPPARRTSAEPVRDLIAFVHVADVERSVAFYGVLGFVVTDTHRGDGRLDWAALQSVGAELMLARAGEPIHPGLQGVLCYLYAEDLRALQQHLRAHGVMAGAICDGSPGPRQEMGLARPRRLRPDDRRSRTTRRRRPRRRGRSGAPARSRSQALTSGRHTLGLSSP